MRKKYLYLLAVMISVSLFTSCGKDNSFGGKPVNLYGGAERSNNYELLGSLNSTDKTYIDTIRCSDQSGTNIPPLVLDYSKTAIVTVNGTVILARGRDTLWTAKLGAGMCAFAGMCADAEQNLYIITNNGVIFSYTDKGKLRWRYKLKSPIEEYGLFADLLAMDDGIIAGYAEGYIVKISFTGKPLWERRHTLALNRVIAGDKNGNIAAALTNNEYGLSDSLVCIDRNGKLLWNLGFEKTRLLTNPLIGEKYIYIAGAKVDGDVKIPKIYYINKKGIIVNKIQTEHPAKFLSITNDGDLIVAAHRFGIGAKFDYVYCYSDKGILLWQTNFDISIVSPLMISERTIAFAGLQNGMGAVVYLKMDGDGTYLRATTIKDTDLINMEAVVSPDPAIYFGCSQLTGVLRVDRSAIDKLLPW